MIFFTTRFAARSAQASLSSMPTTSVLYHFLASSQSYLLLEISYGNSLTAMKLAFL